MPDRGIAAPARRLSDRLIRSAQLRFARIRGRNPPLPPHHRRTIRSWQTFDPARGPADASGRDRPLLLGLTAVWNEEDIIWATVRNLLAEGADDVFVLDDGSSDGTCDEARAAGATVVQQRTDGVYSEERRIERIRQFVDAHMGIVGRDAWWIIVDADEFPRGPEGMTIRELVEELPPWVDVVGSRVLDHTPSPDVSFQPRIHPADAIPLARWYHSPYCPRGHWKHQLFCVRAAGDVYPSVGCHTVGTGDGRRAREAGPSLLMHHVPLREKSRTETKLRTAIAVGGRYRTEVTGQFTVSRINDRLRVLDDLYAGRYDTVPNQFAGQQAVGIRPREWRELVSPSERVLPNLDRAMRNPDAVVTARWFAAWGAHRHEVPKRGDTAAPTVIWNKGIARRCDWRIPDEFPDGRSYLPVPPFAGAHLGAGPADLIDDVDRYEQIGGGELVWVRGSWLTAFVERVLPRIHGEFVLVTGDSPSSVPSFAPRLAAALTESPWLLRWYTQNYDGTAAPDRIRPLPVGVDLHTGSERSAWGAPVATPAKQEAELEAIALELPPLAARIPAIYVDFGWSTDRSPPPRGASLAQPRRWIVEALRSNPLVVVQEEWLPRTEMWRQRGQYAFVLSPHGAGLDCHRTWEALVLGHVVLVPSSSLDPLFVELRAFPFANWNELTAANLTGWLEAARMLEHPALGLTSEHWIKRMRSGDRPADQEPRYSVRS